MDQKMWKVTLAHLLPRAEVEAKPAPWENA